MAMSLAQAAEPEVVVSAITKILAVVRRME
jgi:hypothetical protein